MSIWWMYDNHTFKQLSDDIKEAAKQAIKLFDEDHWGSVGVRGKHQTETSRGIMVFARGDKQQFIKDLEEWVERETAL